MYTDGAPVDVIFGDGRQLDSQIEDRMLDVHLKASRLALDPPTVEFGRTDAPALAKLLYCVDVARLEDL